MERAIANEVRPAPSCSTRRRRRALTAVLATAGLLAVFVPACGAPSTGPVAGHGPGIAGNRVTANSRATSGQVAGDIAFAQCMRSHGVPAFPDPAADGDFPKATLAELATGNAAYATAEPACQRLLPAPSAVQRRNVATQALEFSQCVRRHGVPNFPDPDSDGRVPDPASAGIDQGSPQFQAANQACGKYRPPYMPSNAAYNAWARTSTSG